MGVTHGHTGDTHTLIHTPTPTGDTHTHTHIRVTHTHTHPLTHTRMTPPHMHVWACMEHTATTPQRPHRHRRCGAHAHAPRYIRCVTLTLHACCAQGQHKRGRCRIRGGVCADGRRAHHHSHGHDHRHHFHQDLPCHVHRGAMPASNRISRLGMRCWDGMSLLCRWCSHASVAHSTAASQCRCCCTTHALA